MTIQIGETYRNVKNEEVTIVSEDQPYDGRRVFIDTIGRSYFENGQYYYGNTEYSLMLK